MSRRIWPSALVVIVPTVLLPFVALRFSPWNHSAKAGEALEQARAARARIPWNGSRFAGTPDPPPPFTVALAFPKLKFEFPVVLVPAARTNRLFVGELKGRIYSFLDDPAEGTPRLALDVSKLHPDFSALYGLAFHPQFDKNRYVYICYVRRNDVPEGSVVSRFRVSRTEPPEIEPQSEQVILNFWSGGHNGGCLVFGKDGYLYISTGDGASPSPPDPKMTGQDCSDLLSSILRVDVDRPAEGRAYSIPADNPFTNLAGVRPEIWAFGFRNPWKMSFDRKTGDLWVGDVGWELWELVDKVERGGNYGWSVVEGPQPVNVEARRGPAPILPTTKAHPHSEAASITGGYVYRGTGLPELSGAYIYGDFQTGIIWALRETGGKVTWQTELARTPLHLVAFAEPNGGELLLVDHDRTHQIYKLVRSPVATSKSAFPRKLSESGLYASMREGRPAPGVLPYEINSELWADGAVAERFLAIPGSGTIGIDGQGVWQYPEGSVLARTVSLELEPGKPASRRRVETQILHRESEAWRPYSYFWNDRQDDAELVSAGGATLTITDGGPLPQHNRAYRVAARSECVLCHNPWVEKKTTIFGIQSASPLGVNTAQLNKPLTRSGRTTNQLTVLHEAGILAWTPDVASLPRLVDPYDESADLDRRARSYLQTNCAHCHQFNAGGTANIALGFEIPLPATQTVGIRPIQGTFGIAAAKVIAPGDPGRSILYYRMSKLGGGRMPRVGSSQVDERATRMISNWIERLPDPGGSTESAAALPKEDRDAFAALRKLDQLSAEERTAAVRRLAATTRGALLLLGLIDHEPATSPLKNDVEAIARTSPSVEVRDLFERFIPEEERVKRLGDVIDRPSILALSGDAVRGKFVFTANSAAQCKMCHKAGDVGETIGPDLSKIGAKYDKARMLEQILEPSKTIDPAFTTYLLETKDGKVISGLAVEKTATGVVIKDAQGKAVRVSNGEIERMVPQSRSLMPELLLRDLTAQQVADLLEFLAGLR
jgi:uncharacterized repeat protein (TIGR03806 family)